MRLYLLLETTTTKGQDMKKTVKKQVVSEAKMLFDIIEQRKELEKKEKELKAKFRVLLGSETALDANGVLITLTDRERKSLDKVELSKVVDLKEFEKTTQYQVMNVKKA